MELTGVISMVLPMESGVSKSGNNWKRIGVIIDQNSGQYVRKVKVEAMNERADALMQYPVGSSVRMMVDCESREFNGKWYTSINMWKVEPFQPVASAPQPQGGTGIVPPNANPMQGGGYQQQPQVAQMQVPMGGQQQFAAPQGGYQQQAPAPNPNGDLPF